MNNRINKLILPTVLALTSLLIADTASAQRSGQSMSVQTGIVIVASPTTPPTAAPRPAADCRLTAWAPMTIPVWTLID